MKAPRGLLVWLLAGAPALAAAGEIDLQAAVFVRGVFTRGQPSWLEGGFGRLPEGASSAQDARFLARGQAHLGFDWKPAERWLVHAHGVLQGEPASSGGQRAGLVEAFVQFRPELGVQTALRLRAGTFFPGTSLENSDALWQSPYTLTLSALNAWTAEELRLTGLDAALVRQAGGQRLELAGTAFGLADTSGALLAWRGWSLSDRLTTLGELLPLPQLVSLRPGGGFEDQRPGTRPTEELDERVGWQVRGRWTAPGGGGVRAAYLDNGGDRALYRGQYSWQTRLTTVGLELPLGKRARLLAEGAMGRTGMGPGRPGGAQVDLRLRTGYALLTFGDERWRVSLRGEGFRNVDRDLTAEPDGESGGALTLAVLWSPAPHLRVGAEYLELRARREAAAFSGADADTNARRGLVELRVQF